jgi:cob(I)alamin adenosyltransferase
MALFTGKGDDGTSKLFDSPQGVRISKASPVFEALGMLDELNAITGWCAVAAGELSIAGRTVSSILRDVQDHLFTLQAEVAGSDKLIPQESVTRMSALIESIESLLPETKTFLILGDTELSARFDIARTIARRTERRLVTLHDSGDRDIAAASRSYANRLSSLFYALARLTNKEATATERPPRYQSDL